MSIWTTDSLEITPEHREMSLPMADMMRRQAPDVDSERKSFLYLLGDGIHVTLSRPYANGTIPLLIGDEKQLGDGNWTPGSVNGPEFRVKRAYWSDEDGILVPTGVLEPVIDAMEATGARPNPSNTLECLRIKKRGSLDVVPADGVDIDGIRQLRNDLSWAAFKGADLA